jgi:hypothetical protein
VPRLVVDSRGHDVLLFNQVSLSLLHLSHQVSVGVSLDEKVSVKGSIKVQKLVRVLGLRLNLVVIVLMELR